jgi:hypothetical protein
MDSLHVFLGLSCFMSLVLQSSSSGIMDRYSTHMGEDLGLIMGLSVFFLQHFSNF